MSRTGTKIVHVDVRYTRTSKIADEFFQLRPGTDIAFMGYIISQMLEREKFDKDYVLRNTNAACLLRDDFSFHDGLFSGFDEAKKSYTDKKSWGYALGADGKPQKADDLFAPNTVLSRLKEFYSRYTVEVVSNVTGMPADDIQRAADIWVNHEGPAIIMYALGMTQHTIGVQNIRCFTIMQLLKGQHRHPGRRYHRHARAAKRSGLDGFWHRVQHAAGLPRRADTWAEHAREVDGCLRHVPPQVGTST